MFEGLKLKHQLKTGKLVLVEVFEFDGEKLCLSNGLEQKLKDIDLELIGNAFGKHIDGSGYSLNEGCHLWLLFKYGMDSGYRFSYHPQMGVEGGCISPRMKFDLCIAPNYGESYASTAIRMLARKNEWKIAPKENT